MLAPMFALFALAQNPNPCTVQPLPVHLLKITATGAGAFDHGYPVIFYHRADGKNELGPTNGIGTARRGVNFCLQPGTIYDICAIVPGYKATCKKVRMPDHDSSFDLILEVASKEDDQVEDLP